MADRLETEKPASPVLFRALRPLDGGSVLRDTAAGVELATMNIPQVLGYTSIAVTPPITGLYTLLLPVSAFAVFGSSRYLVVAADSATAAYSPTAFPDWPARAYLLKTQLDKELLGTIRTVYSGN